MGSMKLFYSPGACSLSPHIVARELGLDIKIERMDGKTHTYDGGKDYYAVNPKGSVPALQLDNGELLTEGAVIVQYLADQKPESGLAPRYGTMERYRLQEWLNFIATDLHKQLSPLYNPKVNDEGKAALKDRFVQRVGVVAKRLEGQPWLMGQTYTVADAYLFTILRWTKRFEIDLKQWPAVDAFMGRMMERPAVKAALAAEGL
jgi:glutathione S-transferase